jgi:transposase
MIMGKTASEAAKELKCSVATVSRWADRLQVGSKYGSSYVLLPKEIQEIRKHIKPTAGRPKKNF